jgi:hypothetical protein
MLIYVFLVVYFFFLFQSQLYNIDILYKHVYSLLYKYLYRRNINNIKYICRNVLKKTSINRKNGGETKQKVYKQGEKGKGEHKQKSAVMISEYEN